MEFLRRAEAQPTRLGILSAAFHPLTLAHLGLANSAMRFVDEVLFVMPRTFPHKEYEWVGLEDRLEMLMAGTAGEERYSVAVSDGGLFTEISAECRAEYGEDVEQWFLCGRDAAERIVNWDYGDPRAFAGQLKAFGLLVADRDGRYDPPPEHRGRIINLALDDNYDGISATSVRKAIRAGRKWTHLVPPAIIERVRVLYTDPAP